MSSHKPDNTPPGERCFTTREGGPMVIPTEGAELSDVELLRRAITHSRLSGFAIVEKWRAVSVLFSVGSAVAQQLCKRFGVDPNQQVPDDHS
jgi:hypothetical protein